MYIIASTKCSSWNITPVCSGGSILYIQVANRQYVPVGTLCQFAFMMESIDPMTRCLRVPGIFLLALLFPAILCADSAVPQTKEETQPPKVRAIGRRLGEK